MAARILLTPLNHEVTVPGPWRTLDEVAKANRDAGKSFFDRAHSKPLAEVKEGRFLTTPDEDIDGQRVYHLWAVLDDGRIDQIGEVEGYVSLPVAYAALDVLVETQPLLTASAQLALRQHLGEALVELEVLRSLDQYPDELFEALDKAKDTLDHLGQGATLTAEDGQTLATAIDAARERLEEELDMREWPDALVEALAGVDGLIVAIARQSRPPLADVEVVPGVRSRQSALAVPPPVRGADLDL